MGTENKKRLPPVFKLCFVDATDMKAQREDRLKWEGLENAKPVHQGLQTLLTSIFLQWNPGNFVNLSNIIRQITRWCWTNKSFHTKKDVWERNYLKTKLKNFENVLHNDDNLESYHDIKDKVDEIYEKRQKTQQ